MSEKSQPTTRSGRPRAHVRRAYRAELLAKGVTDVALRAEAFRDRWDYGWLRSFRIACGMTAAEAAYEYNALFGLALGDKGYYHISVIGKNETFPDQRTSRRPGVPNLIGLAMVYGAHPRIVLDPELRQYYSAADLFFLDTYRPPLIPPRHH